MMMRRKTVKLDDLAVTDEGKFTAAFAQFNVEDKDGDVTLPGAFTDGQKVRIAYWGHRWGDLPVGKGTIRSDDRFAYVDGEFFMDTTHGLDTYKTVKGLDELQEWSYGFDVIDGERRSDSDRGLVLKALDVHEVSPVLLGAGVGTHTVALKGADEPCEACTKRAEAEATPPPAEPPADTNTTDDASDEYDANTMGQTELIRFETTRARLLGVNI